MKPIESKFIKEGLGIGEAQVFDTSATQKLALAQAEDFVGQRRKTRKDFYDSLGKIKAEEAFAPFSSQLIKDRDAAANKAIKYFAETGENPLQDPSNPITQELNMSTQMFKNSMQRKEAFNNLQKEILNNPGKHTEQSAQQSLNWLLPNSKEDYKQTLTKGGMPPSLELNYNTDDVSKEIEHPTTEVEKNGRIVKKVDTAKVKTQVQEKLAQDDAAMTGWFKQKFFFDKNQAFVADWNSADDPNGTKLVESIKNDYINTPQFRQMAVSEGYLDDANTPPLLLNSDKRFQKFAENQIIKVAANTKALDKGLNSMTDYVSAKEGYSDKADYSAGYFGMAISKKAKEDQEDAEKKQEEEDFYTTRARQLEAIEKFSVPDINALKQKLVSFHQINNLPTSGKVKDEKGNPVDAGLTVEQRGDKLFIREFDKDGKPQEYSYDKTQQNNAVNELLDKIEGTKSNPNKIATYRKSYVALEGKKSDIPNYTGNSKSRIK